MADRLKARPEILDRRETVEHPFGTIKQWMRQGAFLMRGLDKVRAEFSLTALARQHAAGAESPLYGAAYGGGRGIDFALSQT